MNWRRMAALAGAAACAFSLGVTSVTSANVSGRTFANTFSIANKLCMEVRANGPNKHRKAFATQIIADCTALEMKFQELTTTALAGQAAIRTALAANKTTFQAACPKVPTSSTPPAARRACNTAAHNRQVVFHKLAFQRFEVLFTYHKGLDEARFTFWSAIKALPGSKGIKVDAVIPLPKPPKGS